MTQQIDTQESIRRILITPICSRVMNPGYGSSLFELIDRPVTDEWILQATQYTYEAIENNEPRANIKKVNIESGDEVIICIEYSENDIDKTVNISLNEVQNVAA